MAPRKDKGSLDPDISCKKLHGYYFQADEAPDHPLTLLVGSKATEEMTVTVVTETAEAAVRLQRCRSLNNSTA